MIEHQRFNFIPIHFLKRMCQQLVISTDTQKSSTLSATTKANNENINQNSRSTAIYLPEHGKNRWHGGAVGRMSAFCSFFSSISCLFSSRSSLADLNRWWPWWPLPYNLHRSEPRKWTLDRFYSGRKWPPGTERPPWVEPVWVTSKIQDETSSGWGPQTSARSHGLLLRASAVLHLEGPSTSINHTRHAVLSCVVHLVFP